MTKFERDLRSLLNNQSMDESPTPDYILARYMSDCLSTFNAVARRMDRWWKKTEEGSREDIDGED